MIVGYGRTSTVDQRAGLDAQLRDLTAAGCERIFHEQVSSVDAKRPQLEAALNFVRAGDVFVVTKVDRLARRTVDVLEIAARLAEKGVGLRILALGLDTSTPTGKLMLAIIGSVAEFERDIMLERQLEGIAKAKAEGKYKGRAPTVRARADEIIALKSSGLGAAAIARQLKIGRTSVYRVLDA
jgi:DNA invertase Pin-like site-specific DNA recombinase